MHWAVRQVLRSPSEGSEEVVWTYFHLCAVSMLATPGFHLPLHLRLMISCTRAGSKQCTGPSGRC